MLELVTRLLSASGESAGACQPPETRSCAKILADGIPSLSRVATGLNPTACAAVVGGVQVFQRESTSRNDAQPRRGQFGLKWYRVPASPAILSSRPLGRIASRSLLLASSSEADPAAHQPLLSP